MSDQPGWPISGGKLYHEGREFDMAVLVATSLDGTDGWALKANSRCRSYLQWRLADAGQDRLAYLAMLTGRNALLGRDFAPLQGVAWGGVAELDADAPGGVQLQVREVG
jgi:hypothetical protein